MAQIPIAEEFLASQGYALFERVREGSFRAIGVIPEWCAQIWGDPSRSTTMPLGERSPFLENFLLEAETIWNGSGTESARSGDWMENTRDGREIPLEAFAWKLAGKSILALQNLSSTYAEQQKVYQTARDSLLEHERMVREVQKKEILLHCIVHDLTQPLGAMRGAFDLLAGENLPERTARFVEVARGESLRQEQMIRGILEAFSADLVAEQSATGKAENAADLLECARQVARDFSASFEAHGLRLQLDPSIDAKTSWRVAGDAPRILRIFGNLLENAQRYTPRGKSVTIGLEDRGQFVLAFVDDEGPGLPGSVAKGDAAAAGKLFALFAKGKDRPGKAGLGLYFCKITVERWGGTIGGENRAQEGSRFWFRLPRAKAAHPGKQERVEAAASEKTVAPSSAAEDASAGRDGRQTKHRKGRTDRPMRILIAEDSDANRELLMELLKKRGHSVVGVTDGREAVAAVSRQEFDVLLIDEEMPHMNGIEATRAIRKAEAAKGATARRLVIIGVTGNATEEDEKRFLEAGMQASLPKPVRMEKLFEVVEAAGRGAALLQAYGAAQAQAQPDSVEMKASEASGDIVAHLRRATGGNGRLMRSLAKTFLADAPERFSALRRAIAKKDADAVAKAAHLLKGGLSIFGASRVVEAARKLESMGRAGDLRDAPAAFTALEHEFAQLRRELEALQALPTKQKSQPNAKPRQTTPSHPKR